MIDTNVPLPSDPNRGNPKYKMPSMAEVKSMKVGHSFLVVNATKPGNLQWIIEKITYVTGYKFTKRAQKPRGVRVWRIE